MGAAFLLLGPWGYGVGLAADRAPSGGAHAPQAPAAPALRSVNASMDDVLAGCGDVCRHDINGTPGQFFEYIEKKARTGEWEEPGRIRHAARQRGAARARHCHAQAVTVSAQCCGRALLVVDDPSPHHMQVDCEALLTNAAIDGEWRAGAPPAAARLSADARGSLKWLCNRNNRAHAP